MNSKMTDTISYYQNSITELKMGAELFSFLGLTISQNNLTIPSIFIYLLLCSKQCSVQSATDISGTRELTGQKNT